MMKQRVLCILLCVLLLLVGITACSRSKSNNNSNSTVDMTNVTEIGSGIRSFRLDVIEKNGATTSWLVHTNEVFVAQALVEVGLMEGTFTSFGVLVTSINDIPVNFMEDRAFWGFYINGVFADENHRMDQTEITGDLSIIYSFRWTDA
ncbi:MAG: hypothetical protein FWE69_06235 [Clostridiales bacterium]|nr:hypothetical protein [Clostridiales bacterium]